MNMIWNTKAWFHYQDVVLTPVETPDPKMLDPAK